MAIDPRGMKRLQINAYLAFALLTLFGLWMVWLIVHEISLVNFQYVDYPKDLLN
jgi:hypothetical protein